MFSEISIRKVFILVFVCMSLSMFVVYSMEDNAEAGIPVVATEELRQINEQFVQAKADFEKELPALEVLKEEFDKFLKDVDLNDTGLFKSFRNKVLFSFPADSDDKVGFYGADVIKFLFLVSSIYLDKVLFDRLSDYYNKSVISDFGKKKDLLIALYDEKVSYKDTENFLKDSKSVNSFIDESIRVLDFDDALNPKLFSYIFFNLFGKESAKFLEHQIFPATKTGLWGLVKKLEKDENKRVISIYSMIETMLFLEIFGRKTFLEDNLHTARSFLLKLVGWDYKLLDSYGFNLTKRMIILSLFLKRLNIWYTNLFRKYLRENIQFFIKTLEEVKLSNVGDSVDSVNNSNEALKIFIKDGMNCSFKQWFNYKNSCCANFGLLIEGIILLPVFCKGGMLYYNNFVKEG